MRSIQSPSVFTDSPPQHPNLILGGLQVLFWLFFHPSAWRNHMTRLDPELRPDFCLAELTQMQWRSPVLRRLLSGYLIGPLLVVLALAGILWLWGVPLIAILFWIAASVLLSISISLTVAISASFGVGLALAVLVGIVSGLTLAPIACDNPLYIGLIIMAASGIAGNVAVHIADRRQAHSLARRVGGVLVGLVIGFGVTVIAAGVGVAVVATGLTIGNLSRGAVNGIVGTIAGAAVGGVAFGVRLKRWRWGAAIAGAVSLTFSMLSGMYQGSGFIIIGLLLAALFALPYLLAEQVGGGRAAAVAGSLGIGGLAFVLVTSSAAQLLVVPLGLVSLLFILGWDRLLPILLYPLTLVWNLLLLRLSDRWPGLLRWHSAFWDEHQRLPLIGLDEHLVLALERQPDDGRAAVDYLAASHQRWAAQAAQIEIDARALERCADVNAIKDAHRSVNAGDLEGPASALLRSFSRLSQDADAALEQESAYNQRLALSAVEDRLDGLLRELTRSSERYALRFRPIAARWRELVAAHIRELAETVEQRQEIDSPYVIGVPLTEQQEIFVGRAGISARIEQLLLDRRRPPLLLYGQRRMGKTSLLNNLGRLLPSTLAPMFVDLQGPASRASDHAGFLYNVARGMADSAAKGRGLTLPPLAREALAGDPFTHFDEWLDDVEKALGDHTALLSLDEFEVLESAFAEGHLSETAVLGMLRHLIQHRPKFKVLLAGSHTLDEVQRWASYLINVQVVQIGYLEEAEARLLVEQPVKGFALRYEPEASQRAYALTRGHPFLTQLLCAEIVALKNEQEPAVRRLARLADVEAAVPEALSSGSFFFADIERNQVDAAGLKLLRALAARGEGTVAGRDELAAQLSDQLDGTLAALSRRDLIESANGGYRFQVELIRRWFGR